jgi:hypothetical protein
VLGEENPTLGLRVTVQPLVLWLWIGGFVIAFGTVLAVFPGRRRNPLDPVSAPAPIERSPGDPDDADAAGDVVVGDDDAESEVVAGADADAPPGAAAEQEVTR